MATKEIITFGGMSISFCLEESDTNGMLTMFEVEVQPAIRMPAPHFHRDFDETVYGLEGTVTFTVDGREVLIGPGGSCFIPRGIVHGFENKTDGKIRFLAIANPGVFGPAYFREVAAVVNAGGPPNMQKLFAVLRKHGLVPVMPQLQP